MIRKIINIDQDKCNGCGACASACHEGAIGMVKGKAVLLRDDYCDGLGDCLPACPTGAISFVHREAAEYDEEAVMKNKAAKNKPSSPSFPSCPGQMARKLNPLAEKTAVSCHEEPESQLGQWPCQIKLAPENAPYFKGAHLLIAADCTAFAYAGIHSRFMQGMITLIGCPKLDSVDYSDKLSRIIMNNDIRSIRILRMEVPCCGGLAAAVNKAVMKSGADIPVETVVITIDGKIK